MSARTLANAGLLATMLIAGGCASHSPWTALPPLPPLPENYPAPANADGALKGSEEWKNYRGYVDRMIRTVQAQWERVLMESREYPKSGSKVVVVFRLGSDGSMKEIVRVDGDAGQRAEHVCVTAIALRPSYGPWSEAMKSKLGESQEMTFTFYFQ